MTNTQSSVIIICFLLGHQFALYLCTLFLLSSLFFFCVCVKKVMESTFIKRLMKTQDRKSEVLWLGRKLRKHYYFKQSVRSSSRTSWDEIRVVNLLLTSSSAGITIESCYFISFPTYRFPINKHRSVWK